MGYKYFIKQVDSVDTNEHDLEVEFPTLHVLEVEGLMAHGDPNNIYKESFPESSEQKVYIGPSTVKSNKITIDLFFRGSNCHEDFEAFEALVTGYIVQYRDTYRNKTVRMYKSKATKISSDVRRDAESYMEVTFTFQNTNQ